VAVSLVDASGATVATTRTNAKGDYVFGRLDIGSYRVVVTPVGGPAITSRVVPITRGDVVAKSSIGVPPATPSTVAMSAAFAGLDGPALNSSKPARIR
jgi:hypothetical protein